MSRQLHCRGYIREDDSREIMACARRCHCARYVVAVDENKDYLGLQGEDWCGWFLGMQDANCKHSAALRSRDDQDIALGDSK
jgi:hypothetical protein